MVLVGTVLEVTVLLFEVPTGAVADVYSRRLSVLIGLALVGCGFLLEGSIPLFWAVLGAQVLWGIGYTFVSGALQAWLAATRLVSKRPGRFFLRSAQVELIAGLVGTGASAWLARRWLQLPILLGGALYIALAAFMALIMPERGFRPTPAEERGDLEADGGHCPRRAARGARPSGAADCRWSQPRDRALQRGL